MGLGGAERDRPLPGNCRRRYPRSLQGFGEHSFQKSLPCPSINRSHERERGVGSVLEGGKKTKTGDLKTIEHPEGCERL